MDLTPAPSHSPRPWEYTAEAVASVELLGTVFNATIEVLRVEAETPTGQIHLPRVHGEQPPLMQPPMQLLAPLPDLKLEQIANLAYRGWQQVP